MNARFLSYLILILLALLYGLFAYRKLPVYGKGIVVLVGIVFMSECFTRLVIARCGTSYPSYHLLIPVQMLFYRFIYGRFFSLGKMEVFFLNVFAIVAVVGSIAISLFFQSPFDFPSYGTSLISLLVSTYAILGFNSMLNNPVNKSLVKQPGFWFNLGNLLFYTVTFFTFGFFNPLIKLLAILPEWQYIIIWCMNLVLYSSYFITLLLSEKPIAVNDNKQF